MWVRLAKLTPNSFLWEHRDYADLPRTPRRRLHLPLFTNPSAVLVTGGAQINLTAGYLWRLLPTYAHGACNLLGPDRLHLIIDVYGGPPSTRGADRHRPPLQHVVIELPHLRHLRGEVVYGPVARTSGSGFGRVN